MSRLARLVHNRLKARPLSIARGGLCRPVYRGSEARPLFLAPNRADRQERESPTDAAQQLEAARVIGAVGADSVKRVSGTDETRAIRGFRSRGSSAAAPPLLNCPEVVRPRSKNVSIDWIDDGLPCLKLKQHSRDKLFVLGYYLEEFARAMDSKYPTLVYLDLFAGPGRGQFESGEFIDGSPIIAARTSPPFEKLIFVEKQRKNFKALKRRLDLGFPDREIVLFNEDCNAAVGKIRREIPRFSRLAGGLTFCLIDPFEFGIAFETIRAFSELKIDFLVLIADQMAGERAAEHYLGEGSGTIARFLDDSNWKDAWLIEEERGKSLGEFLFDTFTVKMTNLGFLAGHPMRVKVAGMGVLLYLLAFFSKSERAIKFWENARKNAPTQGSFF